MSATKRLRFKQKHSAMVSPSQIEGGLDESGTSQMSTCDTDNRYSNIPALMRVRVAHGACADAAIIESDSCNVTRLAIVPCGSSTTSRTSRLRRCTTTTLYFPAVRVCPNNVNKKYNEN